MSALAPEDAASGDHRPRPRANTSFLAWRRNMDSTPTSLTSTPAVPVQTLPIDTLIQSLAPPSEPSLAHARSLVTALSKQTPSTRPADILPIVTALCSPECPSSIQAAGFDVFYTLCSCYDTLELSDRLAYFDVLRKTADAKWSQEVWESRLKSLNALFPAADDADGLELDVLCLLSEWANRAFDRYWEDISECAERERAIEGIAHALTVWYDVFDSCERLGEKDTSHPFVFFEKLIDTLLKLPTMPTLPSQTYSIPALSAPTTPQRESSKHRRHPSSAVSVSSPLSGHGRNGSPHQPIEFIASIYLAFLEDRLLRLSLSQLSAILPLLFRTLASVMSDLPTLFPAPPKRRTFEHRLDELLAALLWGPNGTTCLDILRQSMTPKSSGSSDDAFQLKESTGAVRALRLQIRSILGDRMATRLVQRGASMSATPAGVPASSPVFEDYMIERARRAWSKESTAMWDARKVSYFIVKTIKSWAENDTTANSEVIFTEIAGLLKDVLTEMEDRMEDRDRPPAGDFDDIVTGAAVGRAVAELVSRIQTFHFGEDSPLVVPLSESKETTHAFFRQLAEVFLLKASLAFLDPSVPKILLSIAEHLVDTDSERIPRIFAQQHQLEPISVDWLQNWRSVFECTSLFSSNRPRTREAIANELQSVFTTIKDMPSYRRPLLELVFNFWTKMVTEGERTGTGGGVNDGAVYWRIIGEEANLRVVEDDIPDLFTPTDEEAPSLSGVTLDKILAALSATSTHCECNGEVKILVRSSEEPVVASPVPATPSNTLVSASTSPVLSRTYSEGQTPPKEKDSSGVPIFLSLLSFGNSSRQSSSSQVPQLASPLDPGLTTSPQLPSGASPAPLQSPVLNVIPSTCRGLTAAAALVDVFTRLSFVDEIMTDRQVKCSIYIFGQLHCLLRTASCPRARIAVLQALMNLRADRDHRIYMSESSPEETHQIRSLSKTIGRSREVADNSALLVSADDPRAEEIFAERARARTILQRDSRRRSRGRGSGTSGTGSRSRSRAPRGSAAQSTPAAYVRPRDQLWAFPDSFPFSLENAGKASQRILTYESSGSDDGSVLRVSEYMDTLVEIIKMERDWEVLSYVLVHLPSQLANKHFWCGPLARESVAKLLTELCLAIQSGTLGKYVNAEEWPGWTKTRDANGLAYHTLMVLISYQNILDAARRRNLVEVFQAGLSGRGESVVVCTHALTLCTFEMETAIAKELPSILEKLSQIVSNPLMAVHILTFLSILNAIPSVYSNFTEADFKLVFAVALRYLQHHNRAETQNEIPFALSQHVRIMSYSVLYMWFLTLKLSERAKHVQFIVRQLLHANEGDERVTIDVPTEVAFDFLARYTYANADAKPAPSLLSEILSTSSDAANEAVPEKSWIMGYSIVTIRQLAKAGWLEIVSRRASGMSKFLCKSENVPLVDLGDVNPDMITIPASLMMDKDPRFLGSFLTPRELETPPGLPAPVAPHAGDIAEIFEQAEGDESEAQDVNNHTGFVWSGSAPSQRRKQVALDPSYFPLQLSAYPDLSSQHRKGKIVRDSKMLAVTIRSLDHIPVIDTHKVGILYVAPGQTDESQILSNIHGSPAYTRFLEYLGRLIKVRDQLDVYTGGLNPDEDGEYAYAWWDDIGQILYHTATMMPNHVHDPSCTLKKSHIGNDSVRIVWNDSGLPYKFDTLDTNFQFVNIVIEPHSRGAIAAYSDNAHENEYFKLSMQCAEGMSVFTPIGPDFRIVSARCLPILVRRLSLIADWYASIFKDTNRDTVRSEIVTNWRARLETIKRFAASVQSPFENGEGGEQGTGTGILGQEKFRDFTAGYSVQHT